MKNKLAVAPAFAIAFAFLVQPISCLLAQGPLTPPGAPAPTMKTLDQIEPRKEINATNTPGNATTQFVISASGSYYLASNITGVSGKYAIQIASDNVTIDLNGFTLRGVPGSLTGIDAEGGERCIIRNGTVTGFGLDGIDLSGNNIASAVVKQGSVIEHVHASNNAGWGIRVDRNGIVRECTADTNGVGGIEAGLNSTVAACMVTENTGNGIDASGGVVTGCAARNNTGKGIFVASSVFTGATVTHCTATENDGEGLQVGLGSTITGCTATRNGADGILAGAGSTVALSTSSLNGGDGIEVGNNATIKDCTLYENDGSGINASSSTVIEGCAARANQGNGIVVGGSSLISKCVSNLNGKKTSPNNLASDGIEITAGRTRVIDATVFDNAQHGIHSTSTTNRNFIEGCLTHSNDGFGVFLQAGAGDTVIKNQVGGNTGGTINQVGGNIAPIQSASTAVGTMHPLANFP